MSSMSTYKEGVKEIQQYGKEVAKIYLGSQKTMAQVVTELQERVEKLQIDDEDKKSFFEFQEQIVRLGSKICVFAETLSSGLDELKVMNSKKLAKKLNLWTKEATDGCKKYLNEIEALMVQVGELNAKNEHRKELYENASENLKWWVKCCAGIASAVILAGVVCVAVVVAGPDPIDCTEYYSQITECWKELQIFC
eukprot:UN34906